MSQLIKTLKLLVCGYSLLFLTACTERDGQVGTVSVDGRTVYDLVCIDGVEYLVLTSGREGYMSPHLRTDGKPYLCEQNTQRTR